MAIPSQARNQFWEGVETRRAAPEPHTGNGEGIVQTTKPPLAVRRKPKWYENPQTLTGRGGSSPPARTTTSLSWPGWNHPEVFWGRNRPALARHRARHLRRLHTNVCSADRVIALSYL